MRLTLRSDGGRDKLRIDPSLARGLGYYTGAIMEITVKDLPGSLGGGGRYDNLIGMFLGSEVPACGFSLGLERILVVMQERGMFPPAVDTGVGRCRGRGARGEARSGGHGNGRRACGKPATLRVDLYPDVAKKMDKMFKYVDQRRARFIAILGERRSRGRHRDGAQRGDENERDDAQATRHVHSSALSD